MKISYNWLCDYIHTECDVQQVADILTAIGLEVEGVEKIESIPGGLNGVVVGEVVECIKHPDADKLSLTKVNLGNDAPVQIVCGAPNVAAGQKVLIATIGTTLYPSGGEALTIKKGKIRGQESHGMICAEDELGLGTSHAGIMVLDAAAQVGTPAAKFLNITEDYCIEIALTPNRTDAFSHYGVARDLAAALRNMEGIANQSAPLKLPSLDSFKPMANKQGVQISVNNEEACPRYCGITLENVKVGPSPKWLQERLAVIGLRPINNVVDITNYVQHEIGQPLHAFDADTVQSNTIVVRTATEGEKFVTLDGIERTLSEQDLMICDTRKPLCIAGVFGGLNSGVTETTTRVFLESAYFNPVFVRKTAKRHGLKTDASFRFERGADPNATLWALQRATLLLQELAGAQVASDVTDVYPAMLAPRSVSYNLNNAAKLIGKAIPNQKVIAILKDLDITVTSQTDDTLQLSVPLYRSDVMREADVVEEVLRIYGFNNIDIPTRMHSSMQQAPKPDAEKTQQRVADMLSANGFHEMMSMSLTRTKYLELAGDDDMTKEGAVLMLNPLSSDMGMMRQTLLYSALESIALNQNHRNADVRGYEFGKAFFKTEKGYVEDARLSIVLTGRKSPEAWNNGTEAVSFSDLKAALERVTKLLGIQNLSYTAGTSSAYAEALECYSGKILIAKLGAVSPALLKAFDVKQPVWAAEVRWANVLKALPKTAVQYKAPDKYPAVRRDLSLMVNAAVSYADIERTAMETERKLLRGVNLFDVYEGKNLEQGKKSYAVSFTLQDADKTMNDQQVDTVMGRIQKNLEAKLGATLRG